MASPLGALVMNTSEARFPLLHRERGSPESLRPIYDQLDLIVLVDEFRDIVDEFEAWDADAKRVRLREVAAAKSGSGAAPIVPVDDKSDWRGVWGAIADFARARCVPWNRLRD